MFRFSKKIISSVLSSALLLSTVTIGASVLPSTSYAETSDNITYLLDEQAAIYSKVASTDLVYLNNANDELAKIDLKGIIGNDVISTIDVKTSSGTAERLFKDLVSISYSRSITEYNKRLDSFINNHTDEIQSVTGFTMEYIMSMYAAYEINTGIFIAKGIDGEGIRTYKEAQRVAMENTLNYEGGLKDNSELKKVLGLDFYELIEMAGKIHTAIDPQFEARAVLLNGLFRSLNADIYGKTTLALGATSPYQVKVEGTDITSKFSLKTNDDSIAEFAGKSLTAKKEGIVRIYAYALGIPILAKNVKVITKDSVAPNAPQVNKVDDNDVVITGKTESNATVSVKNGSKVVATGNADSSGKFSLSIKKQKANTTLTVSVRDESGNGSKVTSVKVLDKTPPSPPKIKSYFGKSGAQITGTAEPGATLIIKKGSKIVGKGTASSKGVYSIKLPMPEEGKTNYLIYAVDKAGNKSLDVGFYLKVTTK